LDCKNCGDKITGAFGDNSLRHVNGFYFCYEGHGDTKAESIQEPEGTPGRPSVLGTQTFTNNLIPNGTKGGVVCQLEPVGLPSDAKKRKEYPIGTGVIDYFPDALAEIAHVSCVGNQQHNPGQVLHWERSKSTDEADALMRHFVERGKFDTDGLRHSAKMAWRALALLQKELEDDAKTNKNTAGFVAPVPTKDPNKYDKPKHHYPHRY